MPRKPFPEFQPPSPWKNDGNGIELQRSAINVALGLGPQLECEIILYSDWREGRNYDLMTGAYERIVVLKREDGFYFFMMWFGDGLGFGLSSLFPSAFKVMGEMSVIEFLDRLQRDPTCATLVLRPVNWWELLSESWLNG